MRIKTLVMACGLLWWSQVSLAAKVGEAAPDFTLKGHDGKTYQLSELTKAGKTVVLEWYNDDCPYVDKHYTGNNMQKLQKDYTGKGVAWFSVVSSAEGKQGYVDAKGASDLVAARKAAPTAVLLDPEGKVGKAYDAQVTPHMYIIKPDGKLVYNGAIDDKPTARAESLKTATPLFANALNAALAGKPIEGATNKPYGCGVKYK